MHIGATLSKISISAITKLNYMYSSRHEIKMKPLKYMQSIYNNKWKDSGQRKILVTLFIIQYFGEIKFGDIEFNR